MQFEAKGHRQDRIVWMVETVRRLNLVQDTWLLDINPMSPGLVFGGNQTKVVRCEPGSAQINPEYRLQSLTILGWSEA
jgi:hypothetical protein